MEETFMEETLMEGTFVEETFMEETLMEGTFAPRAVGMTTPGAPREEGARVTVGGGAMVSSLSPQRDFLFLLGSLTLSLASMASFLWPSSSLEASESRPCLISSTL